MSEEQKTQPKMKECARFDAAYETMKADPNDKNYLALLEALEGDVREDASAFLPLETQEDLEALQKEGKIKWQALDTQKGRMLTIFTTPAQAAKKGAKANLGLNLLAFFKVLTENKEVAGGGAAADAARDHEGDPSSFRLRGRGADAGLRVRRRNQDAGRS